MKRTAKILLFFLIVLVGFSGLAIYWTFYRPLPDYNANIELEGLNEPVQIYWSSYGVPHIYASNKHDLYMAVGYVHAQDRRWQMTISQLAAQGRFAEFFGKDLLPIDRFQRTIGFWRIAKKMEAQLSDSTKAMLRAYADGVNAYVANHNKALSIQFALADMKPIRWTPAHSLAVARLMAWELNIAWKTELTYSMILEKVGLSGFRELFPGAPQPPRLPLSADTASLSSIALPLLDTYHSYQALMGNNGYATGSNAWAVSGDRTMNGRPLLAGDPHLGLTIPGTWYEVHLNLNGENLAGATMPGAPFIVLGQNDALAWSLTNAMLDDTDFYHESVHPQDSSRYLLDSLAGEAIYEDFKIQREVVKIKNADDVTFRRRLTKHGPVISDVYPAQSMVNHKIITMRWTGQELTRELQALEAMGWAGSLQEFQQAAQMFKVPAQNVIYADTAGNIGRFTLAIAPRRSGNPVTIRNGWNPQLDWQGYQTYSELPQVVNPQRGWVANANNSIGNNSSTYLSIYWQPESRYQRIREYLQQKSRFSTQAFQIMQLDTYSGYARTMSSFILPVLEKQSDPLLSTAVNYLQNWGYEYSRSQTAASIMDVFLMHLSRNLFQDEMGSAIYKNYITYSGKPARTLINAVRNGSSFFDDINTPIRENREEIIVKSMSQALRFLQSTYGTEASEWRWGNIHTITLEPPFFGRAAQTRGSSPLLKLITENVLSEDTHPAPGHAMSINNGEYLWTDPYKMVLGPSIRRIVDLSQPRQSLSIMPGGQSENPFSDFYNDQTRHWLNGQYKFFYQDSTLFKGYKIMRLAPK